MPPGQQGTPRSRQAGRGQGGRDGGGRERDGAGREREGTSNGNRQVNPVRHFGAISNINDLKKSAFTESAHPISILNNNHASKKSAFTESAHPINILNNYHAIKKSALTESAHHHPTVTKKSAART